MFNKLLSDQKIIVKKIPVIVMLTLILTIHIYTPASAADPAPNDDISSATIIDTLPYSNTIDISNATSDQATDPVLTCTQLNGNTFSSILYFTVWYSFTPEADGTLVVDTFGSNYDTVLGVWTGDQSSLILYRCNDDYSVAHVGESRLEISVTTGTTYYIEVANYSSTNVGTLTLNMAFAEPCYALTSSHTGIGSNPVAIPDYSYGCVYGEYHAGETISFSASPYDDTWSVGSWLGTNNDDTTSLLNTTTMTDTAQAVSVNYVTSSCFPLTINHTGLGTNAVATPDNSSGCTIGQYNSGESITLLASPDSGSSVRSWSGTNNDSSFLPSNLVTMPPSPRTIETEYTACLTLTTNVAKSIYDVVSSDPAPSISGSIATSPNCANGTYTYGTEAIISANPSSNNYRFQNWSGDLSGTSNPGKVTMTDNKSVTGVFKKAYFNDVPFDYTESLGGIQFKLNPYIEALWANSFTNGTWIEKDASGNIITLNYSPTNTLNRGMVAKFLLNVIHGKGYPTPVLPVPPKFTLDNWSDPNITWAWPWAEQLLVEGLTNGCWQDSSSGSRSYCPLNTSSRAEAAKFGLTMKYGPGYLPPAATGLVFADMKLPVLGTDPAAHWSIAWAETAYLEGLLPACGTNPSNGKPLFCPDDPMNRAWEAYLIVKAKNITLP